MKRKIITIILCVALVLSLSLTLAACNKASEKKTIVFIGDSISEGVLGPSSVSLRDEFMFSSIIGQRNNYTYYNHAVSGHKTWQFLEFLNKEDDGARMIISKLQTADIIHVSILGNDILQTMSLDTYLMEVLNSKDEGSGAYPDYSDGVSYPELREILETEKTYQNIKDSAVRLRELNPDATIFFQKVYNPVYDNTPLVSEEIYAQLIADGKTTADIREAADVILTILNGAFDSCLEEYPDAFIIIDAQAASNELYDQDPEGFGKYFIGDGVHPTNHGHALLADLVQSYLDDIHGLSANEKTVLKKTKSIRISTLNNYYKNDVKDLKAVKKNINKAKTYSEVTDIFFAAVDGLNPDYAGGTKRTNHNVSAGYIDGTFTIDKSTSLAMMDEGLFSAIYAVALDHDKTNIVFKPNGEVTISLMIGLDLSNIEGLLDTLAPLLGDALGSINTENLLDGINIEVEANKYITALFPGFTLNDIAAGLELLKGSLGCEIVGLDPSKPEIQNLFECIKNGELPISALALPGQIGIRYTGTYYTQKVKSPVTGVEYTAVCLGKQNINTNPFIMMTLGENEFKERMVDFYVDFLGLHLVAVESVEAAE